MNSETMQITISAHGRTFSAEMTDESTVEDTLRVFIGLMIASGYHRGAIADVLKDLAMEVSE